MERIDIEKTPFTVVKKDDGKHVIVIGNAQATDKEFDTLKDAIKHIRKIDWNLVFTFVQKIIEMTEKFKNGQQKKVQETEDNIKNINQKSN